MKKLINTIIKLGTGVIFNGIIEDYGNNFIKLENGIMIQWGSLTKPVNYRSAYGGFHYYVVDGMDYPITFIGTPNVQSLQRGGGQLYIDGGTASGGGSTRVPEQRLLHVSSVRDDILTFDWLAIGRWK